LWSCAYVYVASFCAHLFYMSLHEHLLLIVYNLIKQNTSRDSYKNLIKQNTSRDSYKNIFDINYIIGKETTGRFSCSHFLASMFCYIHNFKPQFTSVLISAFFVCV